MTILEKKQPFNIYYPHRTLKLCAFVQTRLSWYHSASSARSFTSSPKHLLNLQFMFSRQTYVGMGFTNTTCTEMTLVIYENSLTLYPSTCWTTRGFSFCRQLLSIDTMLTQTACTWEECALWAGATTNHRSPSWANMNTNYRSSAWTVANSSKLNSILISTNQASEHKWYISSEQWGLVPLSAHQNAGPTRG
jgi:hypothetical protein